MAAFTFDCQRCGAPIMAAEEMAGKRGRCPHCSTVFSIPDPHTAIAPTALPVQMPAAPDLSRTGPGWREIAVDDEPPRSAARRPRRHDDLDDDDYDDPYAPYERGGRGLAQLAPGWNTVRSGLSLMRTGMIISIIVSVIFVLFMLLAAAAQVAMFRNRQGEAVLVIFLLISAVTGVVAGILFIVGQCMCCAAPPESGARGQAVGSAVCMFIGIGLGLLGLMFLIMGAADRIGRMRGEGVLVMGIGLWILMGVLALVSHVLLIVFLRNIGRCFRNQRLASSAGTYLIMWGIYVGFSLLAMFIAAIVDRPGRGNEIALGALLVLLVIGLAVFSLILLLYFLDLLGKARSTITRATEGYG